MGLGVGEFHRCHTVLRSWNTTVSESVTMFSEVGTLQYGEKMYCNTMMFFCLTRDCVCQPQFSFTLVTLSAEFVTSNKVLYLKRNEHCIVIRCCVSLLSQFVMKPEKQAKLS